jgi:RimJ/RimL family protein N-acetyltransferase
MAGPVIVTERLVLRELVETDAEFILDLLNDPDFLLHIGDKGVRTLDDARAYIRNGPVASYAANGHGLYHVSLKDGGVAVGICGLVRRPTLPDADIGYAFLPSHRGLGYAKEAARATLRYATATLGLQSVLAIVSPGNDTSIRLLRNIGMIEKGRTVLDGATDEVLVFSSTQGSLTARS